MDFYIDTEFNGFGGEILSLGIVSDDLEHVLHLRVPEPRAALEPWVAENVWPHIDSGPVPPMVIELTQWPLVIQQFFAPFTPYIIADWPDDIRYFCELLITGPGQMVNIRAVEFSILRVDAYPTQLENAVQHNALWDAYALRSAVHDLLSKG